MRLNNILFISASITLLLSMNACSGGGSDAQFTNAEEKIVISDCNLSDNNISFIIPDDFTTMISEDAIIRNANATIITTYHDINGTKKICVDQGSAYLLRK